LFTNILQPSHLLILLIVALVFLGPKRLPDAGRALGQGLKEFKNSITPTHEDTPQITTPPTTTPQDNPPPAEVPR
jgi:sec-independent protein translocase protein TatA